MPWKVSIYFYLTLTCSIIGFIFPTHISQAIGFDIGDMYHWVYGFYILIPRNPVGEPRLYYNFKGLFLLISAVLLLVIYFIQLRKAKQGKRYLKNLVYVVAKIQLTATVFYMLTRFIVIWLSLWGFIFNAIFAIIGNRELNYFFINKKVVNIENERALGIVLIALSLIFLFLSISQLLLFWISYGMKVLPFVADSLLPGLVLQLILLLYGIQSLIKVKRNR